MGLEYDGINDIPIHFRSLDHDIEKVEPRRNSSVINHEGHVATYTHYSIRWIYIKCHQWTVEGTISILP